MIPKEQLIALGIELFDDVPRQRRLFKRIKPLRG